MNNIEILCEFELFTLWDNCETREREKEMIEKFEKLKIAVKFSVT